MQNDPKAPSSAAGNFNYFAGIDIGSTTIKIVLIDQDERIVGQDCWPTGSHFHKNTLAAFESLLARIQISRWDVAYVFSTGYGRKLFKDADDSVSEISANASGANKAAAAHGKVKTIINIGGQDLKVIALDEDGHVKNFTMNDKCAAGTGRFLEMTARNLEMEVAELGACHKKANGVPLTINSTCTVFAESEIISLLANGNGKEELVAGVHYSIARRISRLAKRVGIEDMVFFDGGPALNQGLIEALETELMRPVVVPEFPQMTTALGAALIARETFAYLKDAANG
ncbi:MAG: CoA activase [Proteobacteria bacterium]|nr:CoA activase [Pseudomonadota bacterium]MBU1717296.1 CoA activase [Pseudomonadota bacterium]